MQYTCPSCNVSFQPAHDSDELKCPVCSHEFTPDRSLGDELDASVDALQGNDDLPAPAGASDLPAPAGFGGSDLPAPAGFGASNLPAPSGASDLPAPTGASDLPAPTGFGSNLPAPMGTGGDLLEPAELGDLPGPLNLDNLPAPTGLDLSPPSDSGGLELDDLPPLELDAPVSAHGQTMALGSVDANAATQFGEGLPPLDSPSDNDFSLPTPDGGVDGDPFALPPLDHLPSLDANEDTFGLPEQGSGSGFDDMGLEAPSTGGVGGATPLDLDAIADVPPPSSSESFTLDELETEGGKASPAKNVTTPKAPTSADPLVFSQEPKKEKKKPQKKQILKALGLVAFLGAAAGGWFFWQHQQAQKERAAAQAQMIAQIQNQLRKGDWSRAAKTARKIVAQKPGDPVKAVAAQAYFCRGWVTGSSLKKDRSAGQALLNDVASTNHVEAQKATALQLLLQGDPKNAEARLKTVMQKVPRDPDVQLYMAWIKQAMNKHDDAIAWFTKAQALNPRRKRVLSEGTAWTLLQQEKYTEAKELYGELLSAAPDNLRSQVGQIIASQLPSAETEKQLVALLRRGDIEKTDPRISSKAANMAGFIALNGRRTADAETRFRQSLSFAPKNIDAQVGLARLEISNGKHEAAVKALENILKKQPSHFEARLGLVKGIAATEKSEALLASQKLLDDKTLSDIQRARVHMTRAEIFSSQEDKLASTLLEYEKAEEAFGASSGEATIARAGVLTKNNRLAEALEILQPLKDKAQQSAPLAVSLGHAFYAAKDYGEAEKWFRHSAVLNPADVDAKFFLGNALSAQGRLSEAVGIYLRAYESDPSRQDIGLAIAKTYTKLEKVDQASKTYVSLAENKDATTSTLEQASLFFIEAREYERALQTAAKILEKNPGSVDALYVRGLAFESMEDFTSAQKTLAEASILEARSDILEAQGRVSEKLRDWKTGLKAYTEAAKVNPASVPAHTGRARVLIKQGKLQAALDSLATAEKATSNAEGISYLRGIAFYYRQDYEAAAKNLSLASKKSPKDPEVHYRLGLSYGELGDQKPAIRALTRAIQLGEKSGEAWLQKAYHKLGYLYYEIGNKRAAVKSFRQYLSLQAKDNAESREVRALLMGLEEQLRR